MDATKLIALAIMMALSTMNAAAQNNVICTGCVGSSDLATGAVSNPKIKTGAVSNSKIRTGAVTLNKLGSDVKRTFYASFNQRTHYSPDGVVSGTCPTGTTVVSAGCFCDSEGGTRNFGVVFGCQVAGNGGVGGCFDYLIDFNLPSSSVELTLVCAKKLGSGSSVSTKSLDTSAVSESSTVEDSEVSAAFDALYEQKLLYDAKMQSQ